MISRKVLKSNLAWIGRVMKSFNNAALECIEFVQFNISQSGSKVLSWPSMALHLNIIENFRGIQNTIESNPETLRKYA